MKDDLKPRYKMILELNTRLNGLYLMFDRTKEVVQNLIEDLMDLSGFKVEYYDEIEAKFVSACNHVEFMFDKYLNDVILDFNKQVDDINDSIAQVLNEAGGEEDE